MSLQRRTLRECVNFTNFVYFLLNATLVYVRLLNEYVYQRLGTPYVGPVSFAILY